MSFQPGASVYTSGFGSRPENVEVPHLDVRSPSSQDVLYPVGKRWINTVLNETYTLTSFLSAAGITSSNWVLEGAGNEQTGFPITPYVVGPVGKAGYQTIQEAINAAHASGGGTVYIQQGLYVENLTLYDQVDIVAATAISQGPNQGVTIQGTHIPPSAGHIGFNTICFIAPSPLNIFDSTAAGTAHIGVFNCESGVEDGYLFNLPNWTGILEIYDCNPATTGSPWAINDGYVNNTGGATVIFYNTGAGNGTNVMTVSGSCFFGQAVTVGCPLTLASGANVTSVGSQYNSTVSLNGNSIINSYNDSYVTGSLPAITMSSSSNSIIAAATIQSTNNPVISGSGSGTLQLTGINLLGNTNIANTLTIQSGSSATGNLNFLVSGNKITAPSATTTTAGANAFGRVALVGGTATVDTTAVTANSIILLTAQVLGTVATAQALAVTARTAGTSFTITSAGGTDTSTIGWQIIN